MPFRKEQFINNEIYHIVLRGIDNNEIFKDKDDYYRGIFSIYEFNNAIPVEIWKRRKQRKKEKTEGDPVSFNRDLLVEILAFCFMPNHIHLLVKQIQKGGITKFMMKIGAGYGGYFNKKYERKGHVFQNRFVAVPIKKDSQLRTVFTYIHTNPISLIEPKWKEVGIRDSDKVIEFIENYKWSSYPDYIEKKNFSSVTTRKFLSGVINGKQGCKNAIENWVRYKRKIEEFPEISLE